MEHITYEDLENIYKNIYKSMIGLDHSIYQWQPYVEARNRIQKIYEIQTIEKSKLDGDIPEKYENDVLNFIKAAENFCKKGKSYYLDCIALSNALNSIKEKMKDKLTTKKGQFSPEKLWPKIFLFSSDEIELSLDPDEAKEQMSRQSKSGI